MVFVFVRLNNLPKIQQVPEVSVNFEVSFLLFMREGRRVESKSHTNEVRRRRRAVEKTKTREYRLGTCVENVGLKRCLSGRIDHKESELKF